MQQKPILFSTPMVQAILEGRKMQTRRMIKPRSPEDNALLMNLFCGVDVERSKKELLFSSPYGTIGDQLWVRETWQYVKDGDDSGYVYRASDNGREWEKNGEGWKWKPSIFMPKEACRLFLNIQSVHVEFLQDISEEDAKEEGAEKGIFRDGPNTEKREFQLEYNNHATYGDGFKFLWMTINGRESWDLNPAVRVIKFKNQ